MLLDVVLALASLPDEISHYDHIAELKEELEGAEERLKDLDKVS